jgi:hypothetical protein
MNHLEKNELIFQRQNRIIEEFINLLLNNSKRIEFKLTFLYYIKEYMKEVGDLTVAKISNQWSANLPDILIGGLLDPKYYVLLNLVYNECICEFKYFTGGIPKSSPIQYIQRFANIDLFSEVYNTPEVKKLLNTNMLTELWKLSDDEFNKILNDAITIVKTIELFK